MSEKKVNENIKLDFTQLVQLKGKLKSEYFSFKAKIEYDKSTLCCSLCAYVCVCKSLSFIFSVMNFAKVEIYFWVIIFSALLLRVVSAKRCSWGVKFHLRKFGYIAQTVKSVVTYSYTRMLYSQGFTLRVFQFLVHI